MTTETSKTALITYRSAADSAEAIERVRAYLPSNYQARVEDNVIVVHGHDSAGWTLEGYVIPRLASGLIFARPSGD